MAVTDKDPTEAIQLVEQTIGTFNQIVVGQEGQMVPVPGYPDQPTLAERVKQNLKPSTDAAAGYAAQASASAKAADDAAKLASQISGLENVADAIGLAALPLPDVWAPLSDSLRMITGYGRDVLVGSDVVARMVNFSRNSTATYIGKDGQLKTAAANEPRFEKEGLLLDGQSTNLIPTSATLTTQTLSVQAGTHTISFYGTGSVSLSGAATGVATGTGAGNRVALTFTATTGNITLTITGVCTNGQLEALPFASSYIPTNGAAVTRSADVATLPQSLNLGESQLGFSLAVEFDSANTGSFRVLELSDFSAIIADGASLTVRHAGKELYGINAPLGQRHHLAYSVGADGTITAALNGKLLNPQVKSGGIVSSQASITLGNRWTGAKDRALYGHLRDLKIWTKKPLTADQLKVASA